MVAQLLTHGKDIPSPALTDIPPQYQARIESRLPTLRALACLADRESTATDGSGTTPAACSATNRQFDVRQLQGYLDPPQQPDEIGRVAEYRVMSVLGAGGAGIVLR